MATVPVRVPIDDLPAHLALLKSELKEGHTVELVSDGAVIAEVHAPVRAIVSSDREQQRLPMPDFMARLKAIYGEKVYEDFADWIRKDRDAGS